MNPLKVTVVLLALFFGLGLFSSSSPALSEEGMFKIDKEKCALMLRHGKDAFERNRYEDAKYYFQSAVQLNPFDPKPWNWYDLAMMYATAEKMKEEGKYVVRPAQPSTSSAVTTQPAEGTPVSPSPPSVSSPVVSEQPAPPSTPTQPSAPPAAPDTGKKGFIIKNDEGC